MSSMEWTVETIASVDAEIEALPVALRARLVRLLEAVENVGLEARRAPHVDISRASCGSYGSGPKEASLGEST